MSFSVEIEHGAPLAGTSAYSNDGEELVVERHKFLQATSSQPAIKRSTQRLSNYVVTGSGTKISLARPLLLYVQSQQHRGSVAPEYADSPAPNKCIVWRPIILTTASHQEVQNDRGAEGTPRAGIRAQSNKLVHCRYQPSRRSPRPQSNQSLQVALGPPQEADCGGPISATAAVALIVKGVAQII